MAYGINLTDEEFRLLEDLLRRELTDTRSEHRRTRNPEFRSQIEHQLDLLRRLLVTMEELSERPSTILARPCPG